MYYVGKNGHQTGPFTMEELRAMVGKDQLHVDTLVWADGMPQWQTAGSLPGLFGSAAVPPPPLGFSPPGAQATHGYPPPTFEEVPNHMLFSVLVTLLCLSPCGLIALIYASKVNNKMVVGDVTGAKSDSSKARFWCWMALITGAILQAVALYFAYDQIKAMDL
ncbi:MAG: CD225/dispanin family protein [Verrucomicrobium sp.]|nr:CD225/dispanin family protein [Verrucomicrobium sp.]